MLFTVLLSVVTTLCYLFNKFLIYFFVNTEFWNAKFHGVNEKNMHHLLVPKFQTPQKTKQNKTKQNNKTKQTKKKNNNNKKQTNKKHLR